MIRFLRSVRDGLADWLRREFTWRRGHEDMPRVRRGGLSGYSRAAFGKPFQERYRPSGIYSVDAVRQRDRQMLKEHPELDRDAQDGRVVYFRRDAAIQRRVARERRAS